MHSLYFNVYHSIAGSNNQENKQQLCSKLFTEVKQYTHIRSGYKHFLQEYATAHSPRLHIETQHKQAKLRLGSECNR